MFLRLLGSSSRTNLCSGGHNCPGILELESGDFAVIGTDITSNASRFLPPGSGCGVDERIVQIPRQTLVSARNDIPVGV